MIKEKKINLFIFFLWLIVALALYGEDQVKYGCCSKDSQKFINDDETAFRHFESVKVFFQDNEVSLSENIHVILVESFPYGTEKGRTIDGTFIEDCSSGNGNKCSYTMLIRRGLSCRWFEVCCAHELSHIVLREIHERKEISFEEGRCDFIGCAYAEAAGFPKTLTNKTRNDKQRRNDLFYIESLHLTVKEVVTRFNLK